MLLLAASTILAAQSAKLPADVDPRSYSRLPLVQRDQLDANGQRVYDLLNGMRYFEICTLIATREFDQQYVWSAHELSAKRAGVEQLVIDAIKLNRGVEDRQHKVSSTLYAKVVELFGPRGMVEPIVILGD
jgi:hypothetical protein